MEQEEKEKEKIKDSKLHYIYLLQTREFVNAKQSVYKIGKTNQEHNKRFNNYPKGSVLLLQVICNNCHTIEKDLIETFKKKFKLRDDIGAEYFEGNHLEMMEIIFPMCRNNLQNSQILIQKQQISQSVKQCSEPSQTTEQNNQNLSPLSFSLLNTNQKLNTEPQISQERLCELYESAKIKRICQAEQEKLNQNKEQEKQQEKQLNFYERCNQAAGISFLPHGPELKNVTPKLSVETYEIWSKFSNIDIVVINELGDGYFRYIKESTAWIVMGTGFEFSLKDIIEVNSITEPPYSSINVEKIYGNILKVCFRKKVQIYKMAYHEFLIDFEDSNCEQIACVFDSINKTHKRIEEFGKKIILENGSYFIKNNPRCDIEFGFIGAMIHLVTNDETRLLYKKLMYNMLVIPSEKIIFYDYGTHLLTDLVCDLCQALGVNDQKLVSKIYFSNKKEYEKEMKNGKIRYAIISQYEENFNERLEYLRKSNIPNIIVKNYRDKRDFYNQDNYVRTINLSKINIPFLGEIRASNFYELFRHESMQSIFFEWCCRAPNADEL